MLIYDKFTPLKESNFLNNGLGFLTDFKSNPIITKEKFPGTYKLEFDYKIDGFNSEYIEQFAFIKEEFDGTYQIFQIQSVEKTLTKKNIHVYALHVFFTLKDNFLVDVRPTNLSAPEAIRYIFKNAQYEVPFEVIGESNGSNTSYFERKNLVEAISTADNSILNRWGGEIDIDNFIIKYNSIIGNDDGVCISYAKNLQDVVQYIDISEMATRLMPIGNNNLKLPELYVDSPNIGNYPTPIIKTIDVDVTVDEETSESDAHEIMRNYCNEWFENGGDKPLMNFTINFLELSKTLQYYEKYSVLEKVRLGDYVTVQVWGMSIKMRVVSVQYDTLQKKYISIQLGNQKFNYYSQQKNSVEKLMNNLGLSRKSILESAKEDATNLINNVNGGNVIKINGELFIMDTDDPNTATNVWRWNMNGLGFSNNGINGPFEVAMTSDGKIVADFITAGKLNTSLIEGYDEIVIQVNNFDSSLKETKDNTDTVLGNVSTLEGIVKDMNFSFKTLGLKIATDQDPNNSLLDNTGIRVYNYEKLTAIFNYKGSGIEKLIVTGTAQIGYFRTVKSTKTYKLDGKIVTKEANKHYKLRRLIEDLKDLEVK